jgi:2-methylisocitrate lyase-like PEP mutase family enzyme
VSDIREVRERFRHLVESGDTFVLPGAANALTARLIEESGFEMAYVTGAGIANTYLGVPDIGLLGLQELVAHVTAMSAAVDIPLFVDADTGFGNAVSVWNTVRHLERAGASAIQIEDQTFPKRCGHFEGKTTVSAEEMVEKIRAAIEARQDTNLLIVARTDARYEHGLDEACRRAQLYVDAGADIVFVEAPESEEEIERIGSEVSGPKVLNVVQGGKTPELSVDRIHELGFSFVLYANLPLVVGMYAVRNLLESMRKSGNAVYSPPYVSWEERQSYVRKDQFDEMADRFSADRHD